jgi:hypothetical protein
MKKGLLLFLSICFSLALSAQKTVVYGTVVDAVSKQTIPFAPIYFVGTKSGTTSDENGKYRLETYYSSDTLRCKGMGYAQQSFYVKQGTTKEINFALVDENTTGVVVIRPKDEPNPAIALMKKVIANKKINNREKLDAYEYEAYNKVEFDLNNINEAIADKKLMKPFEFIFEGIDTTQEKPYLPVFMTESLSDFYYRRNPKISKEIVKGTRVTGVENQSVNQFLGDMYQNVNIYDNEIVIFSKSFTSPVSVYALGFYDYGLVDSAFIEGKWCYKLEFFPRRKQELLFHGEMWIHDTTYAVKQVDAAISEDANINWIKQFSVHQEYNEVEDEVWMLVKDQLLVEFNLSEKKLGVYGRKNSSYKKFIINNPRQDEFYQGYSDIIVDPNSSNHDDTYWQSMRHTALTTKEQRIFSMADTLKTLPQFKTVTDIITLFVSGYKVKGNFEYGPYYTFYSFNPIEGNRLRFGGRTSNAFSTKLMLDGYLAYGFRDERFKYGVGGLYVINKSPRLAISAHGKRDMEQLGLGAGAFRQDNILSSLFRRNPANKLTDVTDFTTDIEKEWFYGFSNKLIFTHRALRPAGTKYTYTRFLPLTNSFEKENALITSEISLYTRFAFKEKFVYGEFERISLGTNYPEFEMIYSLALPGVMNAEYKYQRLQMQISDKLRFGPFGYVNLNVQAGKIFGNLPYPMLQMHQGNETFFYDEASYNTMNYFEFVSDRWASVWGSYHAEGLFFNKIPMLRKLKWREVVSAKVLVGSYDLKNDELLSRDFNSDGIADIYRLRQPYAEAAIGVENIFKILRVDALWRLSYLNHANIVRFGLRAKLQFEF